MKVRRAGGATIVNWIRFHEEARPEIPFRRSHNGSSCHLLQRPARGLLLQQLPQFRNATIGIRKMLGSARFRPALRLQDNSILLDDFQVLIPPEDFVQESPVRSFPADELSIAEEIDQRPIWVDGSCETKNAQDPFWSEWKRNVQAYPDRITAVKLGPVEVHSPLTCTLDNETVLVR